MNKAAPVLAAALTTILSSSGCVIAPTQGREYGADAESIEEGVTTRAEIVKAFGEPLAETLDGRFAIYAYGGEGGLQLIGTLGAMGRSTTSYEGRLLLEFDDKDRVKRESDYYCRKVDPRCGDRTASLLAMLEKFYQPTLVRTYQWSIGLCNAANTGDHVTAAALLAEGADVNGRCRIVHTAEIGTPLHAAIFDNKPGMVEVLLDHGANFNAKDTSGSTPLHEAVEKGDANLVGLLLHHGAAVNVTDRAGRTPLLIAAFRDNTSVARLLLDHGATVNVRDNAGRTPLSEAVVNGDAELVGLALARGAEVNVKDPYDRTPLHWAAFEGEMAVVQQLLAAGAKTNVVDEDGKTPIDLASDPKVIALLKRYGSKK